MPTPSSLPARVPEIGGTAAPAVGPQPDPLMVRVVGTVGALGAAAHVAFVPLFFWLGLPWMALVNVVSAAVWAAGWLANRRGDQSLAVSLMTGEVVAFTLLATTALGLQAGFQYYMFGAIPFTLFITKWSGRLAVAVSAAMVATFFGLHLAVPDVVLALPSPAFALAFHLANAAIAFAAIGLASYYFRDATVRARAKLEALAVTDSLTGVLNRRRVAEMLDLELARSGETGQALSLVLGEVDDFRGIVSGYGRACGDQALVAVARALRGRLREFDAVGRWGGEEFLVLLPGEDAGSAARIAEALRAGVAVAQPEGDCDGIPLTMTFGVAQSRPGEAAHRLIARVDAALYRGKELGQDAVFVAEAAVPWALDGLPRGAGGPAQSATAPD